MTPTRSPWTAHIRLLFVFAIVVATLPLATPVGAGPDGISVVITDSPDPVQPGQQITYQLTISNPQAGNERGVRIYPVLDPNLTNINYSGTFGGSCNRPDVHGLGVTGCGFGRINSGNSDTLTVTADVGPDATGSLSSSFWVSSRGFFGSGDPRTLATSPFVSATAVERPADLSVTKTASGSFIAGAVETYEITVSNAGPNTAIGATLTDTLPAGLTVNTDPIGCTGAGTGTLDCDLADIVAGGSAVISVDVLVPADIPAGTTITNTATASYDDDPDTSNNSGTDTDRLVRRNSFISHTLSDAPDPVFQGAVVTYSVDVLNEGPSDAAAVLLDVTLPAGTSLSGTPPAGCAGAATSYSCNLGSMVAGGNTLVDFPVLVPADAPPGIDVLTFGSDAYPSSDGSSGPPQSESTTVEFAEADLVLAKSVDPTTANAGETVTYTLSVTNDGPAPAEDVVIYDTLDSNVVFLSSTDCTQPVTDIECPVGTLAVGATAEVSFVATVDPSTPAGTVYNSAFVAGSTPEVDPGNNTDAVPLTVTALADLSIGKAASPTTQVPGANITYTITIDNAGPSDAQSVEVVDTLPTGLTYVSSTAPGGCTDAAGTVTCDVGVVTPAGTSFDLVATVDAGTPDGTTLDNSAVVSSPTDPTPNEPASASVTVDASTDLSLVKRHLPIDGVTGDAVISGHPITYELDVTNDGTQPALFPVLVDTMPTNVDFVSAIVIGGTCLESAGTVTCALPDIDPGETVTVVIIANVPNTASEGETIFNEAAVTADNDPTGATADLTNTVRLVADLVTTVVAVPDPVTAGESVEFTVTIRNDGPSDIPADATFTGDFGLTAGSEGTITAFPAECAPGGFYEIHCDFDELSADDEIVLGFTVDVDPDATPGEDVLGLQWDTFTDIAGDDPFGTTSVDVVTAADLNLTKELDITQAVVGDTGTYTLTVSNEGPGAAPNVVVTDGLPAEVTYQSSTASVGTYDPATGEWTVGDLANGASETLTITVTFDEAGEIENTATSVSDVTDPTPGDATAVAGVVITADADVVLTKTASTRSVITGDSGSYTLTVTNAGPAPATDVAVTDVLPAGVTLDASTPSQGTFEGTTWTVGDLDNGASATLVLDVTFDQAGSITNSATATASSDDPDTGNNIASVTVTVSDPLPETGLDTERYAAWGSVLVLFGAFLVAASPRRRDTSSA